MAQRQPYEQQTNRLCRQLSSALGGICTCSSRSSAGGGAGGGSGGGAAPPPVCLKAQAVAPLASPPGSGAVICQLDRCCRGPRQPGRPAQRHAAAHDGQQLPEVEQLLSANRRLLVTFLADTSWQQQHEKQLQHGQQQGAEEPAAVEGPAHGRPPVAAASKWAHASLQRFLYELDRAPWDAAPPAAVAGESPTQRKRGSSSSAPGSPAAPAEVEEAGQPQAPPVSAGMLAWLAAAHPAAAVARDGLVVQPGQQLPPDSGMGQHAQQQQLPQGRARRKGRGEAVPPGGVSIAEHLDSCGEGCSVHPNLCPVLLIAASSGGSGGGGSGVGSSSSSSSSGGSSGGSCCMVTAHRNTDLASLLRFSPGCLGGDLHLRFVIHQLVHALAALHARGLAMGGLTAEQVLLVCPGWMQLLARPASTLLDAEQLGCAASAAEPEPGAPGAASAAAAAQRQQQQQQRRQRRQQQRQQQLPWGAMCVVREPWYTLPQLTEMWRHRGISNLEYLLWVNAAAGRRWGDRQRHPLVPWVLDFTCRPELGGAAASAPGPTLPQYTAPASGCGGGAQTPPGWRDLGLSQYRRIKGDAQLDHTFAMSSAAAAACAAPPGAALAQQPWAWPAWAGGGGGGVAGACAVAPHHVSNEQLSELSLAIYLARRLPVELLVALVRRSFRPLEYPRGIADLYASSPDEALPQFYTDPQVFRSLHPDLPDLAMPSWASSAEDFVALHRAALESEQVSRNLHRWLDLTFGVALSGRAGLAAKNVHLSTLAHHAQHALGRHQQQHGLQAGAGGATSGWALEPATHGVCQLFHHPHPARSSNDRSGDRDDGGQHSAAAAAAAGGRGLAESIDPDFLLPVAEPPPPPPSPSRLATAWSQLSSLEAAAAAGTWQAPTAWMPACEQRREQQQLLLPAAAADLAAVGQIALQLYSHQQQLQQHAALDGAAGAWTARQNFGRQPAACAASLGLGVPAAVAHFAQQSGCGELSAAGLLRTSFFPPWMDAARRFMQLLLFTQARHACGSSNGVSGSSSGGGSGSHRGSSGGGAFECWQQSDAFGALAELAGPGGEVEQLAQLPEALELCLPAMLHAIRARLFAALPGGVLRGAQQQQQQQQQRAWWASAAQLADSLSVVVLRLASVVSPIQLEQHLVPLLCELLSAEQDGEGSTAATTGAGAGSSPAAAAAVGSEAEAAAATTANGSANGRPRQPSAAAVCAAAARQAALQPVLWQLLLAKLPQQQLVDALLPRLLAAALEPRSDVMAGGATPQQQAPGVGVGIAGVRQLLLQAGGPPERPAIDGMSAGRCGPAPPARQERQQQLLLRRPADAAEAPEPAAAIAHRLHLAQKQGSTTQVQLAASCLAVLAEALPFPVACQHLLRPLLVALPWAGGVGHGNASGGSGGSGGSGSGAAAGQVPANGRHTRAAPVNGAGMALLAIGRALPQQLAAEYVFSPALQLALLPLAGPDTAAAASAAGDGRGTLAAHVREHTLAALPVLEGLMAHVLPALLQDLVLPNQWLPAAAAGLGSSGSNSGGGSGAATAAATGGAPAAPSGGSSANASPQQPAAASPPPGAAASGASSSSTASGAATAPTGSAMQVLQRGSCQLWRLSELLLQQPDARAVQECPLLYARVAALLVLALEQAASPGGGSHDDAGGGSSSAFAEAVDTWLMPRVLQPLLRPAAFAAWQEHGPQLVRAYWRVVLLLYATAARQLGLHELRERLPPWHSVEVLLSSETGWEPQPAAAQAPPSAGNPGRGLRGPAAAPHPLQLLQQLAEQDSQAAAPSAAAALVAAGTGAEAASGAEEASEASWLHRQHTPGASGAREARGSSGGGGGNLSGRVSHLLQRIAAEKVAMRSLSTTHEFLEGVGWSMPRPGGAPGGTELLAQLDGTPTGSSGGGSGGGGSGGSGGGRASPQRMRRAVSAPSGGSANGAAEAQVPPPAQGGGTSSAGSDACNEPRAAGTGSTPAAAHAPAAAAPIPSLKGGAGPAEGQVGRWATELNELRLLLESPVRPVPERGPSAGREWFWLLGNPQLSPTHLLPSLARGAAGSGGASRPWRSDAGCWWDDGWSLGAVALHAWPAHKERMRALAVDPAEHWVATAGRGGARDGAGTHTSSVVRLWELADAETKVQYAGHSAAVHKLAFLGPCSSAVASLDVSGALHVWSRSTGVQLTCFIPDELAAPRPFATRAATSELRMLAPAASADAGTNGPVAAPPAAGAGGAPGAAQPADGQGAASAAAGAAAVGAAVGGIGAGFLERGCSSGRGWQALASMPTSRQLAAGAAASAASGAAPGAGARDPETAASGDLPGSSMVLGAPSAALAMGGHLGFTSMSPVAAAGACGLGGADAWSGGSLLLAGTADGHVCCLDVESGALVEDMVACWEPKPLLSPYLYSGAHHHQQQQLSQLQAAAPAAPQLLVEDPSACVVSAVCRGGGGCSGGAGWLAAGTGSGRVTLLDARAGAVLAAWPAHGQRVLQLQAGPGGGAGWQLLSCGQDRALKLWDLRMLASAQPWAFGGVGAAAAPVATFKGAREGIEGFALYHDAAIVHGGGCLGLAPLDSAALPAPQEQQQPTAAAAAVRTVRMTGIRGGGGGGKAGRDGPAAKAAASGGAIVGLGLLPHSKLLVVGSEDGQLRVCR